jgi:hypothetical protein
VSKNSHECSDSLTLMLVPIYHNSYSSGIDVLLSLWHHRHPAHSG